MILRTQWQTILLYGIVKMHRVVARVTPESELFRQCLIQKEATFKADMTSTTFSFHSTISRTLVVELMTTTL